jgi:hypothetical protein
MESIVTIRGVVFWYAYSEGAVFETDLSQRSGFRGDTQTWTWLRKSIAAQMVRSFFDE